MEQIDRVQVKDDDIYFWEFIQVTKENFCNIKENSVNDIFNEFGLREKNKISIFEKLTFANRVFLLYWEISQEADYVIISKKKEAQVWGKNVLKYDKLSEWFRKINGATNSSAAKVLGAVKESNSDGHLMRIMRELYNDAVYNDDSGVELTKYLLNGDKTMGIDLDLFHYVESTNEFLIFEFLFKDSKQSVTTITSHPMRYAWNPDCTDNRRKFISLWKVKEKLKGRLFLVNYSDDMSEKISVMEVLKIDENNGICGEIKCCMYYNVFVGWLKDLMIYQGDKSDYLSDFQCVQYDDSFFIEFNRRKGEYGKQFSKYYERLIAITEEK